MIINFFGIQLHEFDVAVTDLVLFVESILFAYFLYRKKSTQILLRRLFCWLFMALGASSLLGALFHTFFPNKANTPAGFAVWMLVAASIGATAAIVWCISSLVWKGQKFLKIAAPLAGFYFLIFIFVVFFVDHQFKTIMFFYAPPMAVFALVSLVKFLQTRALVWLGLLIGVLLSFVAAVAQYFQVNIHPVYFNYNALYHVVQGLALAVIFFFVRVLLAGGLKKTSCGIVFGVFDGFHPGHEYFLRQAMSQCDELVVVVTLDDVVLHFKNRLPKFSLAERMEKINSFSEGLDKKVTAVVGDGVGEMGQWPVLKTHQPEVVFLGYDQLIMSEEMTRLGLPTVAIPAHYPDQYKSSIINL